MTVKAGRWAEQGYCWESSGAEGYTIKPCEKETVGTDIILKLKENTEDENYDEYLNEYRLHLLIKSIPILSGILLNEGYQDKAASKRGGKGIRNI